MQGGLLQTITASPGHGWLVLLAHIGFRSLAVMVASRFVGPRLAVSSTHPC